MQSKSDTQLLREYAEQDSEAAFAEIVSRHTDLVYSAALRQVGSPDLARDVAQSVFTDLARKSTSLLGRSAQAETLSGWLYRSTRFSALMLLRTNRRRQEREKEAMDQIEPGSENASDWTQVGPVLDQAMSHLSTGDRDVLLLRFFKNQDYRSIGAALGVSDDTAQKRVSRALEKLRGHLARNNIATSAVTLSTALSAHAVQAAPAGLAASLATASLAGAVAGAGSASTLVSLFVMTKLKIAGTAALLAAAITIPLWQQSRLQKAETEIVQLRSSAAELAKLRPEMERLRKREVDYTELERLRGAEAKAQSEIAKLRGRVSTTQRVDADNAQLKASLARVAPFSEAVTNAMAFGMNQAKTFKQNETRQKVARMKETLHLSDDQERHIRDTLLKYQEDQSEVTIKMLTGALNGEEGNRMMKALGSPDEMIKALLSPEQQASYAEFKQNEAMANAQASSKSEAKSMRTALQLTDEQEAKAAQALYDFELAQSSAPPIANRNASLTNLASATQWISEDMTQKIEKKLQALEGLLTPDQLQAYRDQQMQRVKMMDSFRGMFPGGK